jgi:hypothetical protein
MEQIVERGRVQLKKKKHELGIEVFVNNWTVGGEKY